MERLPQEYLELKKENFRGFQTWNVRSILSHVDMETGFAVNDRIVTPVSRLWSIGHGGYIVFCWDNFFASFMASLADKFISYST
ncbi:MAG: hypothetical protein IJL78_01385 [Lachnospiraceae bacterium]|nr:hypothetical protein [Lachnospiraceae bacterium]